MRLIMATMTPVTSTFNHTLVFKLFCLKIKFRFNLSDNKMYISLYKLDFNNFS